MLSFNNLALRRGPNLLFEGASFTIHQDNKIGLVGANGTGKTSLFKLILGELDSDQGLMKCPSDLRISSMEQEIVATDELSLDYVISGDEKLLSVKKAIEDAEKNKKFNLLGDLHDQFETLDGYSAQSKAEQLMVGLGFNEQDFKKSLKEFSGGWRVRLNLACALMQPSDLLLLDEPTNHLDLDAILWLANWIKSFNGALLLISHDREFLDDCVNNIAYLHNKSIELYSGNYSEFEIRKAARLAELESNFKKQQREVAHMQDFVRRFRAKATKARQAQSRIKALERMEMIAPAHIDSPFEFQIPQTDKISDPLLVLEEADIGYTFPILRNIRISLHPGDRIGLLGPNGEGKSTLIKSLTGEIQLIKGNRTEGKNLNIGYFSQHQVDDLNLDKSALQHIQELDDKTTEQDIRNFLGGFDFRGNKVKDSIKLFSGGEKARLALAKIAFMKPNLLLMDEPTNHLDMDMRQALTIALQSFGGAILLISHDRHLLANTVDEFMIVDKGKLSPFDGDLEDYKNYFFKKNNDPKPESKLLMSEEDKPKLDKKVVRQIRSLIFLNEKRLDRLQGKLLEINEALSSSDTYNKEDGTHLQSLLRDQIELKNQIETIEKEWLELNTKLEA